MKESLNLVRRDMATANQRLAQGQPQVQCPEVTGASNCVSTTVFMVLLAIQMIILISYLMYRWDKQT